jgi:4-amino-4-deoxy-L-arabinose transferase-like glycosyltransferase
MDAAAVTTPEPFEQLPLAAGAHGGGLRGRFAARDLRRDGHRVALGVVLLVTLGLRLWGIKQGLPYSYNSDEASHFVPRAISFFSHDLNPQYFLNPPGYSYLLHIVFELWFGSADAVRRAYASDPTEVFVVARVVAAVLGTLAVWLTYLAGQRLFNRTVALLGAAIFGLAFLPLFYSHLALNDVPALAPVALSLYGVAGVLRNGARRDYVIAGIGIGLASATKYTGGITAVCLLGAFACDAAAGWTRAAGSARFAPLIRLVLAAGCALAAFVIANPYAVLDFSAFQSGVATQQSLAGGSDPIKLGTTSASGTAYYLWTFTWGLGWVPSLAALGGAGLLLIRRRLALALVLLPAPIAFIIFMGDQQRFFGRWLMPVFPIVALLGGYGAVEMARWLIAARRMPGVVAGVGVTVVLLAQSVATAVHNDVVLSRPDTRNLTRAWMVAHVPAGAKVVIEPVVSDDWTQDVGRSLPWTASGARWQGWNPYVTNLAADGRLLPAGEHRYVAVDEYERTLRPQLLTQYADSGYCWVAIGSLQAGRSFAQPGIAPAAIAYYAQLADHARLMYHVSPFASGKRAVPFSFDWSIDYYPAQYSRPGPEMSVYRLTTGKCAPAASSRSG